MSGFVRIEKCQTRPIANRRRDALVEEGYTVIIAQDMVAEITSDIKAGEGGVPQLTDEDPVVVEAPLVVMGIRDH